MLSPQDIVEESELGRDDLLPNIYYLHDRGYVELLRSYDPPLFSAARITAEGIDLVENRFEFNLRYPPAPGEAEDSVAEAPTLIEKLVEEAEFAPLDGEARKCLLRDVQVLRDEVARPVERWRPKVVRDVISWMEAPFREPGGVLPSLARLKAILEEELKR